MSAIPTPIETTTHTTVIQPTRGLGRLGLVELFGHRDLLVILALRDIKVRYKQAALGIGWAVIQPVAMALILFLFFGKLMGLDAQVAPTPYLVFVLAGVLPWTLFEAAVSASSGSVVASAGVIRKVYFPRLIVPLAATGAPLIDYAIGLVVLLFAMVALGVPLTVSIALVPIMIATLMIAVLGVGVLMSAITVAYRDFRHVLPFLLRILFFLTPVIYPVAIMPERFRWLLSLNPVGGTIAALRSAMLGTPIVYTDWLISTSIGLAALIGGLLYFRRAERRFADIV
ncbi:MAG: ABC transporter permease [Phycisphaeraceae bacterium]